MGSDLISDIREQFPQLRRIIRGKRLVYLDSGATTLKPRSVIDAISENLSLQTANVHRGAHLLSDEATERFENVREQVRVFIGAATKNEVIFTRGTTEGVNLIANTLGKTVLNEGDEILLSQMEHHSNIVPWQLLAREHKASVKFVRVTDDGILDFADFQSKLSAKTKIVSLVHLSNSLGTLNPLARFFAEARKFGAYCVADAAQSIAVTPVKVNELGCDFLVFSGHKMFASTGVGVVYGRLDLWSKLPPYQGGGSMISEVREDGVTFLGAPHRYEAGTPPITEVAGLGAAITFINGIGFSAIETHERQIMQMAELGLRQMGGIRQIGTAAPRSHVLSFLIGSHHPSDVGAILDEQGIAVRAGHHCCQPLMRRFSIPGTVRASFSIYTSEEDIRDFLNGVQKAKDMLS